MPVTQRGPRFATLLQYRSNRVDETFDATTELQHIRAIRKIGQRKTYQRSKLERFRSELVALHQSGGSLADLQAWLRIKKTKADRSTISRYLKKLPELNQIPSENCNG